MLEALQDIEIASRLVGFDVDNDDSFDEKYKKLHCDVVPLPHDSEDFQLIEKYLLTTHAPTHTVGLFLSLDSLNQLSWVVFSLLLRGDWLFICISRCNILTLCDILRSGHFNWKKFSHLKGQENLINLLLTGRSLRIKCSSGMVSCNEII